MNLIDKPIPLTKWQKLLIGLKKQGWSQARIAEHCNVTQAAINQLNIGKSKEPRHSLGENLIALAQKNANQLASSNQGEAKRLWSNQSKQKQE